MANNATNVTTGKPKISGAIYRAPVGTTLPTSAAGELDAAFKALGFCSDAGLTNANSMEVNSVKAWGGQVVLASETNKNDTFSYTLIEALNVDVLKTVYGDANVTGTLDTGITIKANNAPQASYIWVFDLVMRDGAIKRIVVPCGAVTAVADIVYNDSDPVGYNTTVTALPDENGNTHYEYILRAGASE